MNEEKNTITDQDIYNDKNRQDTGIVQLVREFDKKYPNNNNGVSWTIFVWAMGVILAILMTLFSIANSANTKADSTVQKVADTQGDIKGINAKVDGIQADVSDIKKLLMAKTLK